MMMTSPEMKSPIQNVLQRLRHSALESHSGLDKVRWDPERLSALRATDLLDSDLEECFDRLTRLAVALLSIPASFISLVDEHRDFYKSFCGFAEPLASKREMSGLTHCHYAIQSSAPLVIPDTAADPVYSLVPSVRNHGVAAYVGIPLMTADGFSLGAFCAIDRKPRQWTATEVALLTELATSATREIELRAANALAEELACRLAEQSEYLLHQAREKTLTATDHDR